MAFFGEDGKDAHCGMKANIWWGRASPALTPPPNDFYPLFLLPGFDHGHPGVYHRSQEPCPALKGVRLACVVRSSAQSVGQPHPEALSALPPSSATFPGVLYGCLGWSRPAAAELEL